MIVSIVAICVAVVSLLLAIRADRRAARLETRGRQANPIVRSRGPSGSDREINYGFDVFNDGPATITRVDVWIADHEGNPISTGAGRDLVLEAGKSEPSWSRWSIPRVLVGSFGFDGKTPKVNTRSPGLTSTFSRSDRSPQRVRPGGSRPRSAKSLARALSRVAYSPPRFSSRSVSRSPFPSATASTSRSRPEPSSETRTPCGRS